MTIKHLTALERPAFIVAYNFQAIGDYYNYFTNDPDPMCPENITAIFKIRYHA